MEASRNGRKGLFSAQPATDTPSSPPASSPAPAQRSSAAETAVRRKEPAQEGIRRVARGRADEALEQR
jgi:hypothetical protein